VPARKRILVVEDDQDLRSLFKSTLTLAGFDVFEARNGFEALRLLDAQSFDLVVLDLMLPGISGVTVRAEIAAQAITRHVPIVVVTGSDATQEELNVACVLRKPVMPSALVSAVHKCLVSGAPLV
jgi:DNA-binding response OmpR family regulator